MTMYHELTTLNPLDVMDAADSLYYRTLLAGDDQVEDQGSIMQRNYPGLMQLVDSTEEFLRREGAQEEMVQIGAVSLFMGIAILKERAELEILSSAFGNHETMTFHQELITLDPEGIKGAAESLFDRMHGGDEENARNDQMIDETVHTLERDYPGLLQVVRSAGELLRRDRVPIVMIQIGGVALTASIAILKEYGELEVMNGATGSSTDS